ncbi:MAG: phosphoglycerate kinase [Calditrichaeota bacterium]|nr:phosphoglycerate kinase [Calditrichota bacterium]
MQKLTIRDIDVSNKTILLRVDFNVPMENGEITDPTRIIESLPTIKYILEHNGRLVIVSHMGRPDGKVVEKYSLKPVAASLSALLNRPVDFIGDCIGEAVNKKKQSLKNTDILLLENVRFYSAETDNDDGFSHQLIDYCDIYVNDAFGTSHRAHSSTAGVAKFAKKSVAGFLIEKELNYLSSALESPVRPFVAIIGGSKISGKIDVINQLFSKVDTILIGGAMIFTFYRAMGLGTGKSLVEEDKIELAADLIRIAKEKNVRLVLPTDIHCADQFANNATDSFHNYDEIPDDLIGLDIGPKSIELFEQILSTAKTVVWNGPMGAFEMPKFSEATFSVARTLAEITKSGAITIVGGGDSAAAINQIGLADQLSHISTGGGASLELLEGKKLPGIECLDTK